MATDMFCLGNFVLLAIEFLLLKHRIGSHYLVIVFIFNTKPFSGPTFIVSGIFVVLLTLRRFKINTTKCPLQWRGWSRKWF